MLEFSNTKEVALIPTLYDYTLKLTEEMVSDVMTIAIEGGINYWAGIDNRSDAWKDKPDGEPISMWATKILIDGGEIILYDLEYDYELKLNLNELIKGIKILIGWDYDMTDPNKYPKKIEDFWEIDAEDADKIIQFALFDEIVYS